MSDVFVIAIGLPRCGGQSLQQALSVLTGRRIWHSVGRDLSVIQSGDGGMVECWYSPEFIQTRWPDAKIIYNCRAFKPWVASCTRVYGQSDRWNNPLWAYPLESFPYYYSDYFQTRAEYFAGEWLPHDFTEKPRWEPLCDFLGVPVPDMPYPNTDRVGRPQTLQRVFDCDGSAFSANPIIQL